MKKLLVTGSTGFIGSHLTEALVKNNYKVKALIHYNSFGSIGNLRFVSKDILKDVEMVSGDVQDFSFVKKISKGVDTIIHLAALIGIPYSYDAVYSYINTNITGTHNILQSALENNISQVIHTSTSEVYGSAEYVPMDEKHPLKAQSPYSATKISADKIAESYWRSFDLPVSIVRPFNTYGPRQSSRAVIPTILGQLIRHSRQVNIGSYFPIRDFTYVADTARAYILMLGNKKSIGEIINIGSGSGISIADLINLSCRILNRKNCRMIKENERVRPRKSEVSQLICNNKKAKEILGWEPQVNLEAGLRRVISFIGKNRDLYQIEGYRV